MKQTIENFFKINEEKLQETLNNNMDTIHYKYSLLPKIQTFTVMKTSTKHIDSDIFMVDIHIHFKKNKPDDTKGYLYPIREAIEYIEKCTKLHKYELGNFYEGEYNDFLKEEGCRLFSIKFYFGGWK